MEQAYMLFIESSLDLFLSLFIYNAIPASVQQFPHLDILYSSWITQLIIVLLMKARILVWRIMIIWMLLKRRLL